MSTNIFENIADKQELSLADFRKLSQAIYKACGISLPDGKRILVEGRIKKRVRKVGMNHIDDYFKYLFSPEGLKNELIPLIDVITTNKTDFFRESAHFDFLVSTAFPAIQKSGGASIIKKKIKVWSAGCSTGEEPYTLAIVLNEYFQDDLVKPFTIYASDISTEVLHKAKLGVYGLDDIDVIPLHLKKKYFLKSRDRSENIVRVVPELRAQVQYMRINLIDMNYDVPEKMDIIFCRNVLIYFDKQTQEQVINNLCRYLNPGGYLLLGHSETITGFKLPLQRAASTVYQKIEVESYGKKNQSTNC
jgi:chemotaxis protein methyltransferase CheR